MPLVDEAEISDPDDDGNDEEADLNGLIPRGVSYRDGPTTEMVPRRWNQTSVTVRRMKDNHQPDLLFEELRSMSRLRHPGNVFNLRFLKKFESLYLSVNLFILRIDALDGSLCYTAFGKCSAYLRAYLPGVASPSSAYYGLFYALVQTNFDFATSLRCPKFPALKGVVALQVLM